MNVANQEIRLRQLTSIEPSAYLMNLKNLLKLGDIEKNTVILAILKR